MEISDQDQQPLSVSALDGGWNDAEDFQNFAQAEDLSNDDLLQFFQDLEDVDMEVGADGDSSSVASEVDQAPSFRAAWLERDLPSPSKNQDEPSDTIADRTNNQQRRNNSVDSSATRVEHCSTVEPDTSTGAWSSTSASEDSSSDDGSRSTFSTCTLRGPAASRDVSPPLAAPACGSISTQQHSVAVTSQQVVCPSAPSGNAAAATIAYPSPDGCGGELSTNKRLTVKPEAGTPILPLFFPAGFGTAAAASSLPFLRDMQATAFTAASGVAGQAMAAGLKRLRGGGQVPGEQTMTGNTMELLDADGGDEHARLLPPGMEMEAPGGGGKAARVKRPKTKAERQMSNRAAANLSRIKKKKELSDLESRVENLSTSLSESRDNNASSQREIASLREQNSFLRGMLAATGNAINLPPILPTTVDNSNRKLGYSVGGDSGGGGDSAAGTSASTILGAVGTGVAVSCAALSAVCFGGTSEVDTGSGGVTRHSSKPGGRRMLMSTIDDNGDDQGYNVAGVWFGGWGAAGFEIARWAGAFLAFVIAAVVLVVVTAAVYEAVVSRRGGGRRRSYRGATGGVRQGLARRFWSTLGSVRRRVDACKMI